MVLLLTAVTLHRLGFGLALVVAFSLGSAGVLTVIDLLFIKTTQRYCRVCNLKVERDYFKAMEVVMRRAAGSSP